MSHPEPWKPEPPSAVWRRRVIKVTVVAGLLLAANLGYDAYDSWRYSNLIEKARSAAALGDWQQSSFALRRAAQIRPGNTEPLILLAETAEKLSPAEAVSLRIAAAMADRNSIKHRFELVRTALRVGDNASASQSLATITTIPGLKNDAIRMLSVEALNRKDTPTARRWIEEILSSGKNDLGDEIQHLELLRLEKSPTLTARLESLQRRAVSNLQSTLTLATWMMGTGNGAGANDWLASLGTNITAHPAVQNARIQSYLLSKDAQGCIRWLESDSWGANDLSRLMWLARLHRSQKQEAKSKAAWSKARDIGLDNPKARREIWQMAVEMGWKEDSMQVLRAAAEAPSDSRWAQMILFDVHYKLKQTPQMLEISERLLRAAPDDWFAKNNVAAFSLLLNTNIAFAAKLAAEAVTTRPNDPLVTSTHAFALQKSGKVPESLLVFGRIPEAIRSKPGVAVYYASALVEAGRIQEARRYMTLADDPSILPEERALLNASLVKASQTPAL